MMVPFLRRHYFATEAACSRSACLHQHTVMMKSPAATEAAHHAPGHTLAEKSQVKVPESTFRHVLHNATAAATAQGYKNDGSVINQALPRHQKSGWLLPENLPEEDKHVIQSLKRVVECRSMADHHKAFEALAADVLWDAPPVILLGREPMRAMVYTAKTIATMTFDVLFAQREVLDASGRRRLHLDVLFHVMPLKPWWLGPVGLVIPNDIQIRATIIVGVRPSSTGTEHEISWIFGRWHNLPLLPWPSRELSAFFMGYLLKMGEPLWSQGLPLMGDTSMVKEAREAKSQRNVSRPY